jgi:hypothetical protein
MKDEAPVLLRMLSSVNHIIDGCVCVDTGSSDSSKQIVKDFFEQHSKPCEIYDHPFVNFSDARNFALQKLQGKEGYGFWIDCDEQLMINQNLILDVNILKDKLKFDLHNINVTSGSMNFARRNFFKIEKDFKWVGAVHEILLCENITVGDLSDVKVFVNLDGNSWSEGQQKKYLKHAEILLAEVQKTDNPRDVFYLAQSYKDAGENEIAVAWYRKRVDMKGGFFEERYYSQFMVGILYERLGKPNNETIFQYLKCSDLDNMRAEHLLNVIILLQREGLWETAYVLGKMAVEKYNNKNPYPNRLLFIDEETYSGKLVNRHDISKKVLNRHDKINGYEINDYSNHIHFFTKLFEYKKFKSVFEYGCGLGSTPFFLDNCQQVMALEMQDEEWYNKVKTELSKHKHNKKLQLYFDLSDNSFDFIKQKNYKKFDLVFVDGIYRGDCINICLALGHKYIVTHDTEDKVYPYGWDKIIIPNGYYRYDFKEYRNWTTIFTNDVKLYNFLVSWKPFDNIPKMEIVK